jgi:hypothetical protein
MTSDRSQDDLQSIQRQIHEKKTSILDSTRRMLGYINESEVVGTNAAAVSFLLSMREMNILELKTDRNIIDIPCSYMRDIFLYLIK